MGWVGGGEAGGVKREGSPCFTAAADLQHSIKVAKGTLLGSPPSLSSLAGCRITTPVAAGSAPGGGSERRHGAWPGDEDLVPIRDPPGGGGGIGSRGWVAGRPLDGTDEREREKQARIAACKCMSFLGGSEVFPPLPVAVAACPGGHRVRSWSFNTSSPFSPPSLHRPCEVSVPGAGMAVPEMEGSRVLLW